MDTRVPTEIEEIWAVHHQEPDDTDLAAMEAEAAKAVSAALWIAAGLLVLLIAGSAVWLL